LKILSKPIITAQPTNRLVVPGSNAVFAVTAIGTTNLTYQWWHDETNLMAGATNLLLTVSNVLVGVHNGGYSVVVSNPLGAVTSRVARLAISVPGDTNGNGLPDTWEASYGLGPGTDRNDDPDGDGRNNWEEYLSGTNPTNALSVLKVMLREAGGNGTTVSFTAMPDLGYSIQYQTNLANTTWLTLTNIAPQPGTNLIQVTDPAAWAGRTIYYRIATPQVP
jgi:hypothetical protein